MTFRIKSTAVELNFWFVAVITFLLLFAGTDSAVCFALCILHEAGHLAAMLVFGSIPKKFELGCFGMKIVTGSRLLSKNKEIITAVAGPCVNIVCALLFFVIKKERYAELSIGLAAFNLLPVPMLDGGRILSEFVHSEKIKKLIGLVVSVGLFVLGIAVTVHTKRNFTILIVSLYLLMGTAIST